MDELASSAPSIESPCDECVKSHSPIFLPLFRRWSTFLLLLLAGPSLMSGQAPSIRFDRLTTEDGLSDNQVTAILQDSLGFMWFGTHQGLNRYDGSRFTVYEHDPADPTTISGNIIRVLLEDQSGDLWVGTLLNGLCRWRRMTDTFTCYRHQPDDPTSLSGNQVRTLHQESDGTLWIGTQLSGLNRWHPSAADGVFERIRKDPADPGSLGHDGVASMVADQEGRLWVGTGRGLDRYDPGTGKFIHYKPDPARPSSLGDRSVNALLGSRGRLWVGHLRGLDRLDPATGEFQHLLIDPAQTAWVWDITEDHDGRIWIARDDGLYLRLSDTKPFVRYGHDPADPFSLSHDQVNSVYEDRGGVLWAGTAMGVSKWNPSTWSFGGHSYAHGIMAFSEDSEKRLWLGTFGGGLDRLDRATGETVNYRHDPDRSDSLADDRIIALLHDRHGVLWVGTRSGGLNRFDAETGTFRRFQHDPNHSDSLTDPWAGALLETRDATLWVGSLGVCRFLGDPGGFECHVENTRGSPYVFDLEEDQAGAVWVATPVGIQRLDPATGAIRDHVHDPNNPHSLSNNFALALHADPGGPLWIGTQGGLNRLLDLGAEAGTARFERYSVRDGLPSNVVIAIAADERGFLWLATNRGLSRFDPRAGSFKNYNRSHGVQGDDFKNDSVYRSHSGELFFGGTEGFNAFFPDRIRDNAFVPPVRLTSFLKLNQPFDLGQPLHLVDEVRLDHRDTLISFEFAALDYTAPRKNRYAYRLEGLTADWIDLGNTPRITFTRLAHGDYVLRVKGSNNDGVWNEEGVTLKLTVAAPPWRSWWAYSLYALAMAAVIVGFVRHQQMKVEREREINRRLREVDKLKDEFLANTSHELRTPLYGITGLAEALIGGTAGELSKVASDYLSMISASGHRLANLVDDILDFSTLRDHKLQLAIEPVNLHALTHAVLSLAGPLVGKKDLELVNSVPVELAAMADEARLQQVLYNLIGNAVKFTDSGRVEVSARPDGAWLELSVTDTGIGISPEHQERIFGSFEQADASASRQYEGTGLGLAISRQLIELHGGRLQVESKPGTGSRFFLTLPISDTVPVPKSGEFISPRLRTIAEHAGHGSERMDDPPLASPEGDFTILVVDDEPMIREVLVGHLHAARYRTLQASSGAEALRLFASEPVDLVLLDVMMPRMSGYEVTAQVRLTASREELPIIFLSARDQIEDLVSGFSKGANDYLTKPIGQQELLARVSTHLSLLLAHRQQAEELQILEGLLPICCQCKRIRDDQGSWTEIEIYVRDRSEADFSHGICSTCGEAALEGLELEV